MSDSLPQDDPQFKRCPRCKRDLPLSAFSKDSSTTSGLRSHCRECTNAYKREYHAAHKEQEAAYRLAHIKETRQRSQEHYTANKQKILEKQHKRRLLNLESMRQYQREYYAANKERVDQHHREYYAATIDLQHERNRKYRQRYPERVRERARKWLQANPDKSRASYQRYQARKRALPSSFSAADFNFMLSHWQGSCAYCGSPAGSWNPITADHFYPLTLGGGTVPDNMLPACRYCNSSKNATNPHDWLRRKFGPRRAARILKAIEDYFEVVKGRDNNHG